MAAKKTSKKAPAKAKTAAKKTVKKTTKKTVAKKASASAKATADKPAKKKAVKKSAAARPTVSQEQFYTMVSEAAYFSAQNDGNKKGSVDYWLEAEAAVRGAFDIV